MEFLDLGMSKLLLNVECFFLKVGFILDYKLK